MKKPGTSSSFRAETQGGMMYTSKGKKFDMPDQSPRGAGKGMSNKMVQGGKKLRGALL